MALKIHPSITADRVMDALENRMLDLENPGFCIRCGANHDSCEPDATKYKCYECNNPSVYGAEWILIRFF